MRREADYTGIPADILAKAAARGNATHKDLENFIKQGTTTTNPDLINFSKYVAIRNIDLTTAKSEQIVYDDQYLIAGTVDFQYFDGDEDIIADFKTTSSIHWDAVACKYADENKADIQHNPVCRNACNPHKFHQLRIV